MGKLPRILPSSAPALIAAAEVFMAFAAPALMAAALPAFADPPAASLDPPPGTHVPAPSADIACPGSALLSWDDGAYENAIAWTLEGVVGGNSYYGAWAERFESDFVCGLQFLFTQVGLYSGQTMDVFLWDAITDPEPIPGNVIVRIAGFQPGTPAAWPSVSVHEVVICEETLGSHFAGFWGNWPGSPVAGWFLVSDENEESGNAPRTKIAPDLDYPEGWQHPTVVEAFQEVRALGIREWGGNGEPCYFTPAERRTWGAIKSLY